MKMFKKTKKDENKTNDIPSSWTTCTSSNPLTVKVTNNEKIKSRNDLLDDFNHILEPIYYAIQDLATRENVPIARVKSQIDLYFAVETLFRAMVHHKQSSASNGAPHVNERMLRILLITLWTCCKKFNQKSTKFWISGCHKRQRSSPQMGDVSVSVFTTTTEGTLLNPTLTNTLLLDSGVQIVPSTDSRNNVEDSPKSVTLVSMPINWSLENEFIDEGDKKCQRHRRVEQRQEKAKKKAELEVKKLELEFERKQRDHDEQMRQLEDKLQIKMLEAELETFPGSSLTDRSLHRIWNCEKFKNMKTQDRYDVAKEKRLCFAYLSDNHAAEECPGKNKCGIDNCEKTHNRLLNYRKKSEVSSVSVKSESTKLTSSSESVRGLTQVARVRILIRTDSLKTLFQHVIQVQLRRGLTNIFSTDSS